MTEDQAYWELVKVQESLYNSSRVDPGQNAGHQLRIEIEEAWEQLLLDFLKM
jgi:hypothetical protein